MSSISEGYNFFSMFTWLRKSYILLYLWTGLWKRVTIVKEYIFLTCFYMIYVIWYSKQPCKISRGAINISFISGEEWGSERLKFLPEVTEVDFDHSTPSMFQCFLEMNIIQFWGHRLVLSIFLLSSSLLSEEDLLYKAGKWLWIYTTEVNILFSINSYWE